MKTKDLLNIYNTKSPQYWNISSSRHLDIGCGPMARNPFKADELFGADISSKLPSNLHQDNFFNTSALIKIPTSDSYFDSISCFDFIEHLDRSVEGANAFIVFMNEASRILRVGGVLLAVTPAFPSPTAFQDPTHVNIITERTIEYFLGSMTESRTLDYGILGGFELLAQFWMGPFSNLRKDEWDSEGLTPKKIWENFSTPAKARRSISVARKPSHLVWVLRKI